MKDFKKLDELTVTLSRKIFGMQAIMKWRGQHEKARRT